MERNFVYADQAGVLDDGVLMATKCIYQELGDSENEQKEPEVSAEGSVSASAMYGAFSISDRTHGVMLTVPFDVALAVMSEALRLAGMMREDAVPEETVE